MKMWTEACLGTAAAAARSVDSGSEKAFELVSVAKSYIGDKAPAILQDCVQLHGGIGVTWDHDLHLYIRRVVLDRSLFGTPFDHRERIAQGLGLEDDQWALRRPRQAQKMWRHSASGRGPGWRRTCRLAPRARTTAS